MSPSRGALAGLIFSGLLAGLLQVGCGATSGTFEDGVYRHGTVAFRVGALPGWEQVEVRGNDLAFYREDLGAIIAANGDCDPRKDPALRTLAMQSLIGFTDRDIRLEEVVPMDGREAMHMIVHAKIDGVARAISLYVLKKDECLYDFTYVAPPERHDHAVGEFERFVAGFHALGDGIPDP